ncbi:MAG: hypothetical protein LUE93_05535 [Bacteroides sp.]|nr:hypothetical protein [Bacteroides sp.]
MKYRLTPSETSGYKWGVYLYEEDFAAGKTLADGYYFYSENEGYERTAQNEEPKHTETARYGERVDVRVAQWETYFEKPVVWPPVPSNRIMLRLTLPKYTPAGATVVITGIINNQGCDYETGKPNLNEKLSDWGSIEIDNKHHYMLIDPDKMYEANALGRSFRFCLIPDTNKPDWQDTMYDHEENKDGSDTSGDVHKLAGAETGMAYDFEIENWRNKSIVQTY